MNWLLFILRLVFGRPASESSDEQRVAVRPNGSTVVLCPRTLLLANGKIGTGQRQVWNWDWLLVHSFGRDLDISVPSVVDDFEHGHTRNTSGGDARQRNWGEFWN